MATISTTNVTATSSWTLLRTSTGNETWSISFEGVPIEVTTNSVATAPADTQRGHRVTAQGVTVTLENNDRLWGRQARNTTIGESPQIILTGES